MIHVWLVRNRLSAGSQLQILEAPDSKPPSWWCHPLAGIVSDRHRCVGEMLTLYTLQDQTEGWRVLHSSTGHALGSESDTLVNGNSLTSVLSVLLRAISCVATGRISSTPASQHHCLLQQILQCPHVKLCKLCILSMRHTNCPLCTSHV